MDEAVPSEGKWMTRSEFLAMIEKKAKEKTDELTHSNGKPLTKKEKKNLRYLYRKRAEVFWTTHGAPPKESSIDLFFEEKVIDGQAEGKLAVAVDGMEAHPLKAEHQVTNMLAPLLIIIVMSLLATLMLLYIFYFK